MIQDTATLLKEQFERRINGYLKGSVDLLTNEFGSEFKLPHPNKIASWRKGKEIKIPYMLNYNNGKNEEPVYEQITEKNFGRWFDTERFKFDDLLIEFEALKKNLVKAISDKLNKKPKHLQHCLALVKMRLRYSIKQKTITSSQP